MESIEMTRKVSISLLVLVALAAVTLVTTKANAGRGNGALGTVYVSSQGLYYDTFVTADELPPHGRFQLLENGVTEFGPGDPGYLGGRWQIPNDDGGYTYLLCPLLPPGREEP
jgi:hypothetical protein